MQMAVTAALNGLGLALQIPTIYTFVADSFDGTSRGVVFGLLMVAGKVGTIKAEWRNAASLARALYTGIAVPMVLCCLVYSFLY
jgi:MFS family permease